MTISPYSGIVLPTREDTRMVHYTAKFLQVYANISEMCTHGTDDEHELDRQEEET